MRKEDREEGIEEFEEREEESEERGGWQSVVRRVLQGMVALVVLVGLVYSSGLYQQFLYQRTPSSAQQQNLESIVDEENITVQLTVFLVRNQGANGTARTEENVRSLVENASRVWEQGSVRFAIKNIHTIERSDEGIDSLIGDTRSFVEGVAQHDSQTINIYLVENVRGYNGISLGLQTVAVADYTTVRDFRVLAHEIGHVLGLGHVPEEQGRLMYQGANGFELTPQEISRARSNALRFQ